MISECRNRALHCVLAALTGGALLMVSGCSTHEEQHEELSKAQEAASESLSMSSSETEDAAQGWGSTDSTADATQTGNSWDSAIPENLEDGEVVLSRDGGQSDMAFQGKEPDVTISFGEQDLYWICLQDSESSENVLLAEVKAAEDGSDTAAWLDAGNNDDLKDPNTVIHGSGSEGDVFSGLVDYGDESFFERNPYFYVYTSDSVKEYQVFAAYTAAEENILIAHDCADFDSFSQYVSSVFEQRSMGVVLNAQLQQSVLNSWCILTLDAQIGNGQSFLVQAIPTGGVLH